MSDLSQERKQVKCLVTTNTFVTLHLANLRPLLCIRTFLNIYGATRGFSATAELVFA